MSNVIEKDTIIFTPQGKMYCGKLFKKKYATITVNPFEAGNKNIIQNIYNKIEDLYSYEILDRENLVVILNFEDLVRIEDFSRVFKILKNNGFKHIEFHYNNVRDYNCLIANMIKEQKAALCLKIDYGEIFTDSVIQNIKDYLSNAKEKENINVHYIIRDINDVDLEVIQDFIKLMYKIGINTIGLRVDNKYLDSNVYPEIPENIKYAFIKFFKTAKNYSFVIDVKDKAQNEFLKKLCKVKNEGKVIKKLSLKQKLKKIISIYYK